MQGPQAALLCPAPFRAPDLRSCAQPSYVRPRFGRPTGLLRPALLCPAPFRGPALLLCPAPFREPDLRFSPVRFDRDLDSAL
jgi:hypothetical protein